MLFRSVFVTSVLCGCFARADVVVSTSLTLTSLKITTPSNPGYVIIPSLSGSAFGSVYDSLGGAAANYDSGDDPALIAVSTALAYANTSASFSGLTESASSGVNIPGLDASAGTNASGPYGQLSGFFEISAPGGPNPVSVTFDAELNAAQSLTTTAAGISAASEVIFQLSLPDIGATPFLFYDNPLTIGPNTNSAGSTAPSLIGTTTLNTNTPYQLIVETDAESSGQDAATPEPRYLLPVGTGLALLFVFGARCRLCRG